MKESNNLPLAIVIEDDPIQADVFANALKMAKFETEVIMDGAEAKLRLTEVKPTIIVLDLHLPSVSGKEILEYIRSTDHLLATPVFLTTADGSLAALLNDSATLTLLKPISFIQLKVLAERYYPKS